jgi:hypothetical protein
MIWLAAMMAKRTRVSRIDQRQARLARAGALVVSLVLTGAFATMARAQSPAEGGVKRMAGAKPAAASGKPALTPLPEPVRPSRSVGPYPVWLAGPDGPIMPPQGFSAMGTIFGAAGPISSGPGGRVCAVPIPPPCARQAETYRSPATRKDCEAAASKHVQETFAYRECLEGEASRAVRATNETIRLLKCGKPNLKDCS